MIGGNLPKGNKIGRSPVMEWTEVPDRPFAGPPPALPKMGGGNTWLEPVRRWWDSLTRMPHCVLWQDSDWEFAIETAYLRQAFWAAYANCQVSPTMACELRRRDDNMGTTSEARRKLRIRYVDPAVFDDEPAVVAAEGGAGAPAGVTDLASRRKRLTG